MIELFGRQVQHRDSISISLHVHNDQGMAVAATELALMGRIGSRGRCLGMVSELGMWIFQPALIIYIHAGWKQGLIFSLTGGG